MCIRDRFEVVNQRDKVIRVVAIAKSAIRNNMKDELVHIKVPTMLIWGKDDQITPPFVADEFHKYIVNSDLAFIDKCGHAPMMERPDEFNQILSQFFAKIALAK